jgi:hypothetical protein
MGSLGAGTVSGIGHRAHTVTRYPWCVGVHGYPVAGPKGESRPTNLTDTDRF